MVNDIRKDNARILDTYTVINIVDNSFKHSNLNQAYKKRLLGSLKTYPRIYSILIYFRDIHKNFFYVGRVLVLRINKVFLQPYFHPPSWFSCSKDACHVYFFNFFYLRVENYCQLKM